MSDHKKAINTYTGEVLELTFDNLEDAESAYLEIHNVLTSLERMKKKALSFIDEKLGDRDSYEFPDGYKAVRISGSRKSFRKDIVAKYLDPDQLDLVLDVNGKRLKDLMAEMVSDGSAPAGAWKDIDANANETPIKPYIKIAKI